ncbi:putative heat shock protein Hsp20 [Gottschalkia acidurici 9a]|uniref:Heat shock protein Hsp20 n=1 Tax=Gottschalkia acidurici (strain ATCC 7906 / DSM 604 / BCRC 14475 / CIP 104303 / KCTC 5404 / NCIMB 10678 / 9a) TaxID=1128398 RepID=K0B4W0_GOTA9|nr:Hsp20 family protein [Gottschalkia acidurici]AFS79915.1 putative heat shock protein Hsp20 [Gottschalkia acidurici 9a]
MMNSKNGSFKVDLKETNESYLVEADLPIIKKEDIDIDFNNSHLIISAKRSESIKDKGRKIDIH